MSEKLLSVARILNFKGLSGEAKVGFTKGQEAKIAALKVVIIKNQTYNVERVRFHKQFAIIKFKEINSIDDLMPLKGENIYVSRGFATEKLDADEYLIEDLIGLSVFDNNDDLIGTIKSVGTNSANDILCVVNEKMGREILIPFVAEIVPIVDIENKKVVVKLIEGLVDDEI